MDVGVMAGVAGLVASAQVVDWVVALADSALAAEAVGWVQVVQVAVTEEVAWEEAAWAAAGLCTMLCRLHEDQKW